MFSNVTILGNLLCGTYGEQIGIGIQYLMGKEDVLTDAVAPPSKK